MAVFIELTTSPIDNLFKQVRRGQQANKGGSQRAGRQIARRPTRGLEIKDDTYATLKVIKSNGEELPLVDAGSPDGLTSSGYANFLLQSVSENRMEKHQVIETFGASYVFFFGEQPRFLDVSAVLINSHDFNWEAEWWANYNTYLRGTKLVEMGARCYLSYDDNVVEGYMMQAQAVKTGDQPLMVQLQFRFFVTNCFNVSQVGNPNFPIRASVQLPANVSLTRGDAGQLLTSNMSGTPLMQAQSQAFDSAGRSAAVMASLGVPGAARSISQVIRDAPPSFAVSADWWSALQSVGADNQLKNMALRAGRPIRSMISDNTDEFVGFGGGYGNKMRNVDLDAPEYHFTEDGGPGNPTLASSNPVRSAQEADDLFRTATEFLSCYGANINSPSAYGALGIGPSFSTGLLAGATFGATVGGSFGFAAGSGVGLGAVAGGGFGTGVNSVGNSGLSTSPFSQTRVTSPYQVDSLGVVYGNRSTQNMKFSSQRQQVMQTGFDYNYGYQSDFAPGPGFGMVGFGDYGGGGYGAGYGAGDPGFKDPNRFTFAGVSDNAGAYERFLRTRYDRTALTNGPVVGRGEMSGGASIAVGGLVSAFALVSVEGTLDLFGGATTTPQAISARQAATKFGFAPANPYGVSCPNPGFGQGAAPAIGFSVVGGAGVSAGALLSAGASFAAGARVGAAAGVVATAGVFVGV